ncbi:MAG: MOSC N-terminal beta barrel domain-containing protein [Candidatus Caldarchaeum sp.]
MTTGCGVVRAIYRYPVKSMGGEELEEAFITFEGVEGDRRYALVDVETGLAVSAKNPKLYSKLLDVKASISNGRLVIQMPDGKSYESNECEEILSAYMGRKLKLVRNDGLGLGYTGLEVVFSEGITYFEKNGFTREKTFHDSMPVHVIAEEDLRKLCLHDEVSRFRPNIVVSSIASERKLLNLVLEVGDAVLKIVKQTKRCIMVTLPQKGLRQDMNILKTIRESFDGFVGLYAQVIREGVVRRADPLKFYAAETL